MVIGVVLLTGCNGSNSGNDNDTENVSSVETTSNAEAGSTTESEPTAENESTVESGTTPLPKNVFHNGFRLATQSKSRYYAGDEPESITEYKYKYKYKYKYDFSNNEITITSSSLDEENEPKISKLYIDQSGRLVGGSYDYEFGTSFSGTTNYNIRYNGEGKVIEYAESQYDISTFNYVNGFLDNIIHQYLPSVFDPTGSAYTYKFTYDAQGKRTSSQDGVTKRVTQFEYNAVGQISRAVSIGQLGRQLFSYEFG